MPKIGAAFWTPERLAAAVALLPEGTFTFASFRRPAARLRPGRGYTTAQSLRGALLRAGLIEVAGRKGPHLFLYRRAAEYGKISSPQLPSAGVRRP
jgi:hypothetical protein